VAQKEGREGGREGGVGKLLPAVVAQATAIAAATRERRTHERRTNKKKDGLRSSGRCLERRRDRE